MFYEVAPVERFRAGGAVLTYRSTEKLKRGQVAEVPFGKKTVTGVVMEEVKQPKFETKPVVRVISEKVLPGHLLKAAEFVHKYYVTEMPVVWQAVLPPSLLSLPASENLVFRTPTPKTSANLPTVDQSSLPLNTSQETAVKAIKDNPSKTVLLHGVTGSGKTNIYIKLIAEVLAEGKSAILLVPEIALSAQLIRAVREYFPDATLLHSQQTPKTRRELWLKTLEAEGPQVVVGPRSALFAPVRELGLVIIDEAHEPAYHQDKMPKYSALRVASAVSPKTVLGTATPTIVDYSLASSRDAVVKLSEKAKAVSPAEVSVVDLRERSNLTRNRFFSRTLMDAIAENLGKGEQSLIYHNRRGSAAITMCEECGWQSVCSECLLPMTLHLDKKKLLCHACGKAEKQPLSCPECGTAGLLHKGIGTKILEAELVKLFPQARVARFDGDNKKNETMAARYAEVAAGEVNILVGTQTLAKGFDLPKLTLVGVVQADQGLVLPDFAAEERCFQLLSQVVGRVGRHEGKSRVVVQTYQPEAPAVVYGVEADYEGFFARSLELRRKAKLPPYVYLMKLARVAKTETTALRACQKLRRELVAAVGGSGGEGGGGGCGGEGPEVEVSAPGGSGGLVSLVSGPVLISAPMPAFYEYGKESFEWQLVVRAVKRADLLALLSLVDTSMWRFDLEPPSLL